MTTPDPRSLYRNPFRGMVAVILGAVLLSGCGGKSASTPTSSPTPAPIKRPSRSEVKRLTVICHRSETTEDQNIITQFANSGYTDASPAAFAALKKASVDVSRENVRIRSAITSSRSAELALVKEMSDEALVSRRAARLVQAPSEQEALLVVLHRRITQAHGDGVWGCAGAQQNTLRAKAPSS